MLRQEMDIAYGRWIARPGAYLGVFDNNTDYEACKSRVHCNATHGSIAPRIVYNEASGQYELDESEIAPKYEAFISPETGRRHTVIVGGEHNNVYFPDFIKYKQTLPECLMQSPDGRYLELKDILISDGQGIPMPAIDDPTLMRLNARSLALQARALKDSQYVAAYMTGFEMLYPEYFGLGHGDFRPASWKHFAAWCGAQGIEDVPEPGDIYRQTGSRAWSLWHRYREQAMADRCANYYKAILDEDPNHLTYYPTHGSTLCGESRWQLGQQPDTLAAACDGLEMGHILIEDDQERRNAIMVAFFAAYGKPVIVPRLGNKQPDLSAIGGGRSFTPQTLRRLVYECVGLGVHTVFPIHWTSRLHDGEWFIKDTAAEAECRAVFDELTLAAPYFNALARLQPQVGLLASDASWLRGWNPRWTGLLQDALSNQVSMTLVTDALVSAELARKMPVLLLVDNRAVMNGTLERLIQYLNAGGHVIIWGAFGEDNGEHAPCDAQLLRGVLSHPNTVADASEPMNETRALRELFLSGPEHGVDGTTFRYQPVDFERIMRLISGAAPDCVLKPARLVSDACLKDVNVYPLTDRAGLGFVLVNNAAAPVALSIAPDERLQKGGEAIDMLTGEWVAGPITLAANATRLLYFYPPVTQAQMLERVLKAEEAYAAWRQGGYDTQSARMLYAGMRSGLNVPKRHALAEALLQTLAIRTQVSRDEKGLTLQCALLGQTGGPVKHAHVSARLSPGSLERFVFSEEAGTYTLFLPNDRLPRIYDMDQMAYRPLTGRVRIVLSAEADGCMGGSVVHAQL